ncbi:sensor histidine kinase [Phaeocystidibacter marisrubri]|uniref:histidine kinase n=1 Tax=Phaeocystidibacter marisrubri TaxID=1577780 RepID=A0A6L3ZHS9_9FLAO|nr:HAMP domain-containing sensor histidine kinase [Phaeocystidibacter marisrubri]KAB2817576.1 HAMP domain-containing histidine kinase [Phaeocystidibacter marisrubri]GGH74663.1 two-component sensor histidine kinase [Phaeocystidibacter marisrubri]
MTNNNSKILIGFITAALIGSIVVQVYLFSNAVEVRKARFDSEVMEAMRTTGEDLEDLDAKRIIEQEENFRPWLQSQIPHVFQVDSAINPNILDRDEIQFLDSTGFYTFSFQADTTYYSPAGPYRVEVSQEGSGKRSDDGKIHLQQAQMHRVEEKVLMMDTVLQMFVRNTMREYVPIGRRFDLDAVDSVLKSELEDKGIASNFEFALSEDGEFSSLISEDFESYLPSYKVQVLRNDLWDKPVYLHVQLPNKMNEVYSSMWTMVALSLVFTLGVVITFWTTIRQMLKQKKISSIKSDFINNMTHEFKTPLATINLAIDALNSPKLQNDPEKRAHYTQIIRNENQRMHKQVEHVLRMSLLDKDEISLERENISLSDLIEGAKSHLELTVEQRGGFIQYNPHGLEDEKVNVDHHHFSNVLINIIDNAVKYSMEPPHIRIDTELSNSYVVISISDNGIGMSREVREHIFDRFYRAESGNVHTVKGHGLGLAYAKEIIDRHGGKIEVKSTVGEGSTFVITLERS